MVWIITMKETVNPSARCEGFVIVSVVGYDGVGKREH